MPKATRKSKVPLNQNTVKKTSTFPAVVVSLAAEYELDLATLLDWKVYPSGKIVLITPNGMKLVREVELAIELEPVHPNVRNSTDEQAVEAGDVSPVQEGGKHAC